MPNAKFHKASQQKIVFFINGRVVFSQHSPSSKQDFSVFWGFWSMPLEMLSYRPESVQI
jgi:hypothetical protein